MMMELIDMKEFYIIDDDPINNFICKKMIEEVSREVGITTFESAYKGIEQLKNASEKSTGYPTHIMLDLNMPDYNGWQFLEDYENLQLHVKHSTQIFVVSSTILKEEIDKIKKIPFVTEFISKPLTLQTIKKLVETQDAR